MPKAYAAPLTGPDASYSGLLECPCTDRITKTIAGQYSLQAEGSVLDEGRRRIVTSTECFAAASKLGLPNVTLVKDQGSDQALPAGCSLRVDPTVGCRPAPHIYDTPSIQIHLRHPNLAWLSPVDLTGRQRSAQYRTYQL